MGSRGGNATKMVGNREEDKILRSTELSGVIGRDEMNKLALVCGEDLWNLYRDRPKVRRGFAVSSV